MKKYIVFSMLICFLLVGCHQEESLVPTGTEGEVFTYSGTPCFMYQNVLYWEEAYLSVFLLEDENQLLGTIEKRVDEIPAENWEAALLPSGTKLYSDLDSNDRIYVTHGEGNVYSFSSVIQKNDK